MVLMHRLEMCPHDLVNGIHVLDNCVIYASSLDEGPKYVEKKSKMKSFYERSLKEEYE